MEDVSTIGLLFRLVVSLGAVLGLMALAARGMRGRGLAGPRTSSTALIQVLGRQGLSRAASVAVVRAGGRDLVLGVTESSVTLLVAADAGELVPVDDSDPLSPGSSPTAPSWKALLETLRDRSVRRV